MYFITAKKLCAHSHSTTLYHKQWAPLPWQYNSNFNSDCRYMYDHWTWIQQHRYMYVSEPSKRFLQELSIYEWLSRGFHCIILAWDVQARAQRCQRACIAIPVVGVTSKAYGDDNQHTRVQNQEYIDHMEKANEASEKPRRQLFHHWHNGRTFLAYNQIKKLRAADLQGVSNVVVNDSLLLRRGIKLWIPSVYMYMCRGARKAASTFFCWWKP